MFKFVHRGVGGISEDDYGKFVPQVLLLMPLNQLAGTIHDCRIHSLGEKMLIAIRDEEYEEYFQKSGAPL